MLSNRSFSFVEMSFISNPLTQNISTSLSPLNHRIDTFITSQNTYNIPNQTMGTDEQFTEIFRLMQNLEQNEQVTEILRLMQTLKEYSSNEICRLRKENVRLKMKVHKLSGSSKSMKPSRRFSEMAMADCMLMAKSTHTLEGLAEMEVVDENDGMLLTDTAALDPTKSSYATGYDYSLLTAKEVLITMHDVGEANKDIDRGPGMWANYILNKERNNTLKCVNKSKLQTEGKYYHLKSLREGLEIDTLISYCKNKGIRAIVPTSVSDEIYLSDHKKDLMANSIYPFCSDDSQSYVTLDHKWLSYQFCVENGIAQAITLPLRVDTAEACRELVAKTIADGKPCFVKECFDTLGGDGVIKVDTMEEYEDAITRITEGRGPQQADTSDVEQHVIVQAGHPGRIACCHSVFYKGSLVSCYVTKENEELISKLGELRLDMAIGTWSTYSGDLTTSFKLDLDDPSDRSIRDQAVSIMTKVGKKLNYTGMLEVELIIDRDPDAILNVLEFNPRFSGACHSYVGAGMVQDYMHVLGLIVTTEGDTKKVMLEKAGCTHIRSDTHVPRSNFKDYNAVKFYLPQPLTMLKLRKL